ncbi:YxeA family protein [Alkalicoccobacillus porphyridii]|uniref:YxeA family protein n=1 Tax=Alkalicoccobacillus porphyridii TaxID=2597270 RepID=A0A554A2J8_9BACI|nr:YxeA family protein [Alkalicoccobacillus porphyridii]TSB47876.1 YxeA family protein [Alkalicoccobacillus porphyridii]
MKKILISTTVVLILLASLYLIFREEMDRFNPLVEKEYVYVQLDETPKEEDRRFRYTLTGMNESGESKTVSFTTSAILEEGTYVRVLAKGRYTENYEIVEADDVPIDE